MSKRYAKMKDLACYVSINLYDMDKDDIDSLVETVGCIETVVDFLLEYQDRYGLDLREKVEWALISGVLQ